MKTLTNRFACALLLLALLASIASAKVTARTITFGQDFAVGGTLIKAGTYRLSFDDRTNELSVLDKRTKAVLAKTAATMERSNAKRRFSGITMVKQGDSMVLTSVGLPRTNQIIKVSDVATASVR